MKTAVDWLEDKLKTKLKKIILESDFELMEKLFEQAKAMEKQQIIKAYMNVKDDMDYRMQDVILKEFAEQYYNEITKELE